jgi:hypothetical protein
MPATPVAPRGVEHTGFAVLRLAARRIGALPLAAVLAVVPATLAPAPLAAGAQEKTTKEGTTALVVTGCLKGRVLTVTRNPEEAGAVVTGPDVVGRSFRLAGPKDVMAEVKAHDGDLVEMAGLVRSSDLARPLGVMVGNTRIAIGVGPMGPDGMRAGGQRDPFANVVVMDATALRFISDSCPIQRK